MSQQNYKSLLLKNTFFSAVQQSSTILFAFILMPFMIWKMGGANYGYWLLLKFFSIKGFFAFAGFGIDDSMTRYLTKFDKLKEKEQFQKLYFSGLSVFVFIGIILMAGTMLFNHMFFIQAFKIPSLLKQELTFALGLYAFAFIFQAPALALKTYYMSQNDYFKLKSWDFLNSMFLFLLILAILPYNNDILTVVIIELSISFVLFIIFLILPLINKEKNYSLNPSNFSIQSIKEISSLSGYIFMSKVTGVIYSKTPTVLIGYFLSPIFITYYAVASKIPLAVKTLQGMINSATLPIAVIFDSSKDYTRIKKLLFRGTRYSFFALTPLIVFLFAYADIILKLWVGESFIFLASYLRCLLIWSWLTLIISFGSSMYTRKSHFKDLLPYNIVSSVLFISVTLLFIKSAALWSILIATFISGLVTIYANASIIKRICQFDWNEFFKHSINFSFFCSLPILILASFALKTLFQQTSILKLLIQCGMLTVLHVFVIYKFGLFKYEKKELFNKFSTLFLKGN